MTRRLATTCTLLLICSAAGLFTPPAQAEEIEPIFTTCLPVGDHGLVEAQLEPPTGWSSVRVYFRDAETEAFYFMEMRGEADGRFWAMLPIPEIDTEMVDMYFVATNAEGSVQGSSVQAVPVLDGCRQDISVEQVEFSENLVVGETTEAQAGKKVLRFKCDHIVSRIAIDGNVYPDAASRLIRFWLRGALFGVGGVGVSEAIRTDSERESSQSNPGL